MNDSPAFNKILRLFRDELTRPEVRSMLTELEAIAQHQREQGRPLREDFGREWENTHVLLEIDRKVESDGIHRVLDLGGGNSPVAYWLARRGFEVQVVDTDPAVVQAIRDNSANSSFSGQLGAALPIEGRWPAEDDSIDLALSISVYEGILRSERPGFWSEMRRVLRPGASLLITFDFGPDARFVGDPPTTLAEIERDLIEVSGMELVGPLPTVPDFDPLVGPPVKAIVPTVDGMDHRTLAYTFCALELRNPDSL